LKRTPVAKVMDVLNFCQGTKGGSFGSLVRKHPEYSVAKSPENFRGPSIMLMSRFAPELNLKKLCHALNDCIHLFKRARVEQFTGLWPNNVSYCWVQNPKCYKCTHRR